MKSSYKISEQQILWVQFMNVFFVILQHFLTQKIFPFKVLTWNLKISFKTYISCNISKKKLRTSHQLSHNDKISILLCLLSRNGAIIWLCYLISQETRREFCEISHIYLFNIHLYIQPRKTMINTLPWFLSNSLCWTHSEISNLSIRFKIKFCLINIFTMLSHFQMFSW